MRPRSYSIRHPLPWTWVVGVLAGLLWLVAYIWRSAPLTEGHFIFALDDPYISMGIAKNLLQSGTWGTSPQDFSSASSSILWPIALAISFIVTRFSPYTPYLLNLGALLWGAYLVRKIVFRELGRMRSKSFWSLALFWIPALAAPVTSLLLTGLEHIWHWIAVFSAVDYAAVAMADPQDKQKEKRALWWAMALTLVRYETMALVGIVGLLFMTHRRFIVGLKYWAAGSAPVVIFGLWSMMQGGMFFPNSLVLKASPGGHGLWGKILVAFERSGHSLTHNTAYSLLIVAAALILILIVQKGRRFWELSIPAPYKTLSLHLLCFSGMALAHSAFASFGWLFRYEAYLLAWGSFSILLGLLLLLQTRLAHQPRSIATSPVDAAVAVASTILKKRGWAWYHSLALIGCVLYSGHLLRVRSQHASKRALLATRNIYEQQYQFSRFLKEHYPGQAIAMNDIGAASFFPGVRVIDLYGLGSTEVAIMKNKRQFQQHNIAELAQQYKVPVAIVYDRWFRGYGGMPPTWSRVGRWKIRNNVICGDHEISFYSTDPKQAQALAQKLRAFAPKLPARVDVVSDPGFDLGASPPQTP